MDLLDLLNKTGGRQSLGALGRQLGLDNSKTGELVQALAPALLQGMQKQTLDKGGLSSFSTALEKGNHQQYLDNPDLLSAASTLLDGNGILGHLFGSKDVSRSVAAKASEATGIDTSLVKQALPLLAGLAMGAISKNKAASHAKENDLADMFSGLDTGGFDLNDVLGLAKKFF